AAFNINCFLNLGAGSYTICVTDINGCIICQNDTLTDPPNGISSMSSMDEISIYPNPSASSFIIEIKSAPGIYMLSISDELGRVILKSEIRNQEYEIETGILREGIYFVNLHD